MRHTVKVIFEDGNSLVTGINGTREEVVDYYLDNEFNLGNDKLVRGKEVIFLEVAA